MSERKAVRQFFGDAEHDFILTPELVVELERKLGAGIGALFRRFLSSDFGFRDLRETIRLGLIGGGMSPAEAAHLVDFYSARMAVFELYRVALPVLDELMTGAAVQRVAKSRRPKTPAAQSAEEAQTQTEAEA